MLFKITKTFSSKQTTTYCCLKYYSSMAKKRELHIQNHPPANVKQDLIGPPDTESNIRPMVLHVPENETGKQRRYREMRLDVNKWNHEFWARHNKSFFKEKEEFVKDRLEKKRKLDESEQALTPEELSEFYKAFLNRNYREHVTYNKEWYKKNVKLLWPALQVYLESLTNKMLKMKKN